MISSSQPQIILKGWLVTYENAAPKKLYYNNNNNNNDNQNTLLKS